MRTYFLHISIFKGYRHNSFFSFRDAIVYATSTFTEGLPTVMNILSDGIFRQNIDDDLVRYSTYSTELSYNVKK